MTQRRVEIAVEGKVVVDADVTKAKEKIKGLSDDGLIGQGPTPSDPSKAPSNPFQQLNASYFGAQAERALAGILPLIGQEHRTPGRERTLDERLDRALSNAQLGQRDDLVEVLTGLKNELQQQRLTRGAGSGGGFGGGGARPPGSPPPPENEPPTPPNNAGNWLKNVGGWLEQQGGRSLLGGLSGTFGGAVGGALFSGASRLLAGPAGWALGGLSAANWAFNAVSNAVTEKDALGRTEILGQADLARQYGIDRNIMPLFRTKNGWSNNRFQALGYTASEAEHVAAQYDRPGGMLGDVTSILGFSRSTGMNEGTVSQIARQFGIAGVGGAQGGHADESLRVLKLAVTEGLKDGIAGSDSVEAMKGYLSRISSGGNSVNGTSLAYFAQIMQRLNADPNGNPAMRGQAGASLASGFMAGVNNQSDPGMNYLLTSMLMKGGKLPSARALGLTLPASDPRNAGAKPDEYALTDEGVAYESMRQQSPLQASRYLLERASTGKNPTLLSGLYKDIDAVAGGNTQLRYMMYKQLNPGASDEQVYSLMGGKGLSGVMANNPQSLQAHKTGQSVTSDVQAGNVVAADTLKLRGAEADRALVKSLASLQVWGNMERSLSDIKNSVADLQGGFAQWFANYGNPQGSLAGEAGVSGVWFNGARGAPGLQPGTGPGTGAPGTTYTPAFQPSASAAQMRMLSAVAQKETTNGKDPAMDAPGTSMSGLFQLSPARGRELVQKYLGAALKGDNTAVREWLRAHPKETDQISAQELMDIDGRLRAQGQKDGVSLSDAQYAGLAGMIWHRNGGGSIAPALKAGKLVSAPLSALARAGGPDGVSDYDYFLNVQGNYTNPQLRPAALRGANGALGGGVTTTAPSDPTAPGGPAWKSSPEGARIAATATTALSASWAEEAAGWCSRFVKQIMVKAEGQAAAALFGGTSKDTEGRWGKKGWSKTLSEVGGKSGLRPGDVVFADWVDPKDGVNKGHEGVLDANGNVVENSYRGKGGKQVTPLARWGQITHVGRWGGFDAPDGGGTPPRPPARPPKPQRPIPPPPHAEVPARLRGALTAGMQGGTTLHLTIPVSANVHINAQQRAEIEREAGGFAVKVTQIVAQNPVNVAGVRQAAQS